MAVEQRLAETEESDASVDILAELAETYTADVIDEALSVAREHLDMEVAYVSRFEGDRQVFRAVDGDPKSFRIKQGGSVKLDGTYCKRVADGTLPNLIPDARRNPLTKRPPIAPIEKR